MRRVTVTSAEVCEAPWRCPVAQLGGDGLTAVPTLSPPPPQSAFLGPPAGEQPDADGGVPARAGRRAAAAAAGGGLRGPGLRQRAGRRHLQLLLLPLVPGARLCPHHDDAHQLVQVRGRSLSAHGV